jgi:histidine ammonia-lyase
MVIAETHSTISGGNFHGEYPAKVLDYLAIGVHELANISEVWLHGTWPNFFREEQKG